MEKKKFSFLADEHTGSATLNSDAPVVGERAKEAQQKQAQEKQEQEQEKKEQEEKEQQAGKCYVMNGAVLKCNLCTQPEGELVVTSNTIGLQADVWATEADKAPENLVFKGNCRKSPKASIPCRRIIQPDKWKGVSDIQLQGHKALLETSTIKCNYGGIDILIEDHLQVHAPITLEDEAEAVPGPEGGYALKSSQLLNE